MRRLLPFLVAGLATLGCGSEGPTSLDAPAAVRVVVGSTGLDLPALGLDLFYNGQFRAAVTPNDTVTFAASPGRATVDLVGFPANCTTADNSFTQQLSLTSGDTTTVAFAVTCVAATGVVHVSVTSTGLDLDDDGYLLVLDGKGPGRSVSVNGQAWFGAVPAGDHVIALAALAPNCSLTGPNPLPGIRLTTGGLTRDTVHVAMAVTCATIHGAVRIQATTTGTGIDPDGYDIALGTRAVGRVGVNGTLLVSAVLGGNYLVGVTSVAPNCGIASVQPATVTVVVGDTAVVQLAVQCDPPTSLRISVPTTGANPDTSYSVSVDGAPSWTLPAADTLLVNVTPGPHVVTLGDVTFNCSVTGGPQQSVTVALGAVLDVVFPVDCVAIGNTTGFTLTTVAAGTAPPDTSYTVAVCQAYYCDPTGGYVTVLALHPDTTLSVSLPPGDYYMVLGRLDPGCVPQWVPGNAFFSLSQGQMAQLTLTVTCAPLGDLSVNVSVSGADTDSFFYILLDGGYVGYLTPPSAPLLVTAVAGAHTVALQDVASNCVVAGGSGPQAVNVVANTTTAVVLDVTCQPWPNITVNLVATGTNLPATLQVGVDLDWYYGWSQLIDVPANGSGTAKVLPGTHLVGLANLPANCVAQGLGAVQNVYTPLGQDVTVSFTIACQ